MIYLEEFELVDFQTHKKTTIKFSPHFNVIVGSTRSGKSSAVRALDFFLYNNWYEDYVRFGASKAVLKGKLSNGKIVIREKGPKTNKILLKEGSTEQRFESFGTSLPDEIAKAIGVTPIDIGIKDPIFANVANQDDPLFLLYDSGTDRTKVLSRLSGLHWIDYALKDLSLDRRTKSSEIQILTDTNVQLLEKLKAFKDLTKLKKIVEEEKERLVKVKKLSSLLQNGRVLISKTSKWKADHQEMQLLKTVNFPVEIARLEKIIYLQSEVLQPLQELNRKLSATTVSIANTQTHLRTLQSSQSILEQKIAEEKDNAATCPECGQEIKQKV